MKMTIKCFICFLIISSCDRSYNTDIKSIDKLINSEKVDEIVEGYFIIGEEKKVQSIPNIFSNVEDSRISHHYKFKGISVYQSKMIAMKKISRLNPPVSISSHSDSVIIAFYYKWALDNKYINIEKQR